MTPEMLAMLLGFLLLLALCGLAALVQHHRDPMDGTSWFVYLVGFVVFLAILGLMTRAGA